MSKTCCPNPAGAGVPAPTSLPCPENGARAKRVGLRTVKALVRHLPFRMPSTQYYFCEAPECDIVYFAADPSAPIFRRADLLVRVEPKEPGEDVPVCYCFGIARREIADELARTGRSSAAERIRSEVKAGRCACEVKNPSGRCCLGRIARAVEQLREASSRG
ncbi:MAG: (2Fe-2S)-binding protein [Acidobacteriia bacterium]|jgi:hypothetical protein|nr:(2Fe-2S)-binding protein [Terriglobia bacterium]